MSRVEGKKELPANSYTQFIMMLDKKRKDVDKMEPFMSDDDCLNWSFSMIFTYL